jgi:hypothetical protein
MDTLRRACDQVLAAVKRHCEAKGYAEGPGVNNFAPHDAIAAVAMARLLVREGFDHYVAVAPEGHIYGYFLERLGVPVLSVFTDYPPTPCESVEDLSAIRGGRVLLIEDDVASGRTLRLVVDHLQQFDPGALSLYLGHTRGIQRIDGTTPEVCGISERSTRYSFMRLAYRRRARACRLSPCHYAASARGLHRG